MDEQDENVDPEERFGECVEFNLRGKTAKGRIVYAFRAGSGLVSYHVRDEGGQYWHRTASEMTRA